MRGCRLWKGCFERREIQIFREYEFPKTTVDEHTKKNHEECHGYAEDYGGCNSETSFSELFFDTYREFFD